MFGLFIALVRRSRSSLLLAVLSNTRCKLFTLKSEKKKKQKPNPRQYRDTGTLFRRQSRPKGKKKTIFTTPTLGPDRVVRVHESRLRNGVRTSKNSIIFPLGGPCVFNRSFGARALQIHKNTGGVGEKKKKKKQLLLIVNMIKR